MAESRKRRGRRVIGSMAVAALGATGILAGLASSPVSAATFVVNSNANDGAGSLRNAIAQANLTAGEDTITFSLPNPSVITLNSEIRVTDDLRIEGPGQLALRLVGPNTRVLDVDAGSLHVESLTIDDVGSASGNARSALIFGSSGDLSLDDVSITGATKHGVQVDSAGSVTVTDSTLADNASDGINAMNVTGNVSIDNSMLSNNNENIKLLSIGGTVTIDESTSTGAVDDGGDIRDSGGIAITSSRFDSNDDHLSILGSTGPVTITDSSFQRNLSDDGVSIQDVPAGVTIARSTFADNPKAGLNLSGFAAATQVNVVNSTFSGNGTSGLVADAGVTAEVRHSTFVDNAEKGINVNGGTVSVSHSIIVDNAGGSLRITPDGSFSATYSLFPTGENPGGTGNLETADAMLGDLVNNGGPTRTHLPLPGSPAIGAGNPAVSAPPATDQRGSARIVGVIDIGAVERTASTANAGVVKISPAATTASESSGVVQFSVARSGGTDGAVSVRVRSQNGTATAPADYTAVDQVVSFANGEGGAKVVNVTIVNDTVPEADETLQLELSDATGGVSVDNGAATLTIDDDDAATAAGTISISPSARTVAESVGSVGFTINRTGGSQGTVSVRVVTEGDTADADDDFTSISRIVTFASGDTAAKSVAVEVIDDALREETESLTIRLTSVTGGAALGTSSAQLSITDNDADKAPDPTVELDLAGRFVPLPPERLFDTRPGEPANGPKGKLAAGQTIDVQITGVAGVPANATAVVMNVTMTESEAAGFVTAWAAGAPRPDTSNLNYTGGGQTRPNLVTVPIGADGKVSLFTLAPVHVLGDVAGYFVDADEAVAGGRLVPLSPTRLFDTRPGEAADGPKGLIAANSSIDVQVLGKANVPATGVSAVVMNLTATESGGPGFVTAHPTDQPRPLSSVLNMSGPGETVPNLVVLPVGADGQIRLYSYDTTHLLGDVMGYFTDGAAAPSTAGLFVPLAPDRVFDSRPAEPAPGPKGLVGADTEIDVNVGGVGQIPADAGAVMLNVTATEALDIGFITGWPTGEERPFTSLLNLAGPGDTRPNSTVLPLGSGGQVSLYAYNGAHLLADSFGYFLG